MTEKANQYLIYLKQYSIVKVKKIKRMKLIKMIKRMKLIKMIKNINVGKISMMRHIFMIKSQITYLKK
jgi:hypothetical protein